MVFSQSAESHHNKWGPGIEFLLSLSYTLLGLKMEKKGILSEKKKLISVQIF